MLECRFSWNYVYKKLLKNICLKKIFFIMNVLNMLYFCCNSNKEKEFLKVFWFDSGNVVLFMVSKIIKSLLKVIIYDLLV